MPETGHFQVQTPLFKILSDQYRSGEEALKELVTNCWDADATRVDITLPLAFEAAPITVRDNGRGMTSKELEASFLRIAFDRRRLWGEKTPSGRVVRGHRGVGKFAAFAVATRIRVETSAQGRRFALVLDQADWEGRDADVEELQVPIQDAGEGLASGTLLELFPLRPGFEQPSPNRLGVLLLREFLYRDDFQIFINGARVSHDLVEGKKFQFDLPLVEETPVKVTAWIPERPREAVESGIQLRVDGRAVGPPSYFGLDQDPDILPSVLHWFHAEVEADHLRDDLTPNWEEVNASSLAYQDLQRSVAEQLKPRLLEHVRPDPEETDEGFVQQYAQQLELLPYSRRQLAEQSLLRIFRKLFREPQEKKKLVAQLVLNIFEHDRYWLIAQRLDEIAPDDLLKLAGVLREWGLGDVAELAVRARERLHFLDYFERLATAKETLEFKGVHRVLETHTWIIGDEYELWVSNRTLRRIVRDYADELYRTSGGNKRPDLVLVGLQDRYLLIEFKRPAWELTRQDIAQAEDYRDGLVYHLPNKSLAILVLGGTAHPTLVGDRPSVRVSTYSEIVLAARTRLQWLLGHLDEEAVEAEQAQQTALDI